MMTNNTISNCQECGEGVPEARDPRDPIEASAILCRSCAEVIYECHIDDLEREMVQLKHWAMMDGIAV